MTDDDTLPRRATSRIDLPAAPADQQAILDAGGVACWADDVEIDTYEPGAPDPYPAFLERRVYQGSSGRVYPLPMTETISHAKRPRLWRAIHLENAYVRLMLLPEIGGRIHIGYDKVAGYDFFYRNNVIKPALVGLAGPWMSGGVEFNWPQHHRPATFLPVDSRIERERDGGVVVWHSDLDPLQRMRGLHGIRLRPGSSLIELDARLHNRTDVPQTFLWWANVAARSHERYQSFFPDDVRFVADHARRAITAFPRADRPYYGVDYPALAAERPDADRIDVYSNIPVPTSYMITDTADAFFGGYDHDADAGFVHWADPALSPGKKQWTWGDGPIGRVWDDQLTDTDGPYVELMAGVYTDNQPDFAWLVPGETKTFRQYWYPIHATGPVRQATTDAAVSVSGSRVSAIATSAFDARITITLVDGSTIDSATPLGPDAPWATEVAGEVVGVTVRADDRELVAWRQREEDAGEPWVATAPPQPTEIDAADELYATAMHLIQYRHPTRSPLPYLGELLRRDPGDIRARTALGAWHLHRGAYTAAREHLEIAVARETRRNLNPRDGEAHALLALVLERLGDAAGADRRWGRAGWNAVWAAPAALGRARIALRAGRPGDALQLAESAASIPEAQRVRVFALRALGRDVEAREALDALVAADPLDPVTMLLAGSGTPVDPRTALDAGAEFARVGAWREALEVTATTATGPAGFGNVEPTRRLLRAAWADALGDAGTAATERAAADALDLDGAFPAGLDQYDALVTGAARGSIAAASLLGSWLIDAGRDADAREALQRAVDGGAADPVTLRNLALATVRAGGDPADAADLYERTLHARVDGRLVLERDLVAQLMGTDAATRLTLIERHRDVIPARDDLSVVHVGLLLDAGHIDEAWAIVTTRTFRAFEGGEGVVLAAYDRAACAVARRLLAVGDAAAAVGLLEAGIAAPANLGEGRHPSVPLAERLVLLGDARRLVGDAPGADAAWQAARAATPLAVAPRPADAATYWIGVAHTRLGERELAAAAWDALDARAAEIDAAPDAVDYFATSLPELLVFDLDTPERRRAHAEALRALAVQGRADAASVTAPERMDA
ncbi:tetratricopeptide (TPR) repeat protein [Microbacterium marinum]|uniref:Tetratricopeptide (TPR) repeat protein n=1 Tax=Microbacterium marinum TaxID=421115 RepID=A0A7W7BNI0_9MICO|nr:tetratricopeptide (TPR) repeat protein [Microbacterium marinum]